jgi:tripartite-type tricarboxylate transporter receptor subunit TctC
MRNGKNDILWLALFLAIAAPSSFAQRAAPAAKDYPARVIRIVVPYGAGAGPDVVGRIIELGFPAAPSALPFIGAGRLRVLGITAEKRWNKMPEVPTLDEAGVKGYRFVGWYGFWFPAGTPGAYVSRIQAEVARAVKDPVVRQRLEEQGLEGVGSTTEEFAKAIEDEFVLNKKLTSIMGIVPQ